MNTFKSERSKIFSTLTDLGQDTNILNQQADLEKIITYHCDHGDQLRKLLAKAHNYIKGRRGTGKTALMVRAYAECMCSWDSNYLSRANPILDRERVLGVYINLQTATRSLIDKDEESLELSFVETLLKEIIDQVEKVWHPKHSGPEADTLWGKVLKSLNKGGRIDKQKIDALKNFNRAVEKLVERIYIPKKERRRVSTYSDGSTKGIDLSISKFPRAGIEATKEVRSKEDYEIEESSHLLPAADVLKELENSRKEADISGIYVFLDEYSNLSPRTKAATWDELYEIQKRLSRVLKALFRGYNIYFKIAVITDRYTLGHLEPLQDIYEISADIDDLFKLAGSFAMGMKKLEQITETILKNRVKVFASPGMKVEHLFDMDVNEAIRLLTKASMCIPRTMGRILQNAYRLENSFINEESLKKSIRDDYLAQQKLLNGTVGKVRIYSESYYVLWKQMLKKAMKIREEYPQTPVSHFYVHSKYEEFLRPFRENYLIHRIQSNVELPGREIKKRDLYDLYAFDYGACASFTNYGLPEAEDFDLMSKFNYSLLIEPFFQEMELTFRCEKCERVFRKSDFDDITTPNFCIIDGGKLTIVEEKTEFAKSIEKLLLEVELRILQFLVMEKEPAKAIRIAKEIGGCTYQKAAWFAKKNPEWISRRKEKEKSAFVYWAAQIPDSVTSCKKKESSTI